MKCSLVHKALSAIETAEEEAYINLDHGLVSQLKEKGLLSAYSTWFYQEMVASAAKLEMTRKRLKETKEAANACNEPISSLEGKVNSSFRSLWWSPLEITEMEDELSETRDKYALKLRAAERLEEKIRKLEAMPDPEGYKPTFDGNYVKLSEKGKLLNAHLSGRLDELEDILLEDVEWELDEFQSQLDTQYSRFIGMYNLMVNAGFKKEHNDVIDCAVRLSTIEGTVQDVYGRMGAINDHIYEKGIKTYNRLIPSFAVTRQDGDIGMLKEELTETYNGLMKYQGYIKYFFPWWLASAVMELNRFEVERNIERYKEVLKALVNKGCKGWEKWHHTRYMAVSLARRHDSAEDLAAELHMLKEKLVKSGRLDDNNTGTAALILMDYEGTLEERVDRFTEAFMAMHSNGWDKHSYFYPAAAAISLMPGSVEGNVLWLDNIVARLKNDGFADKNETKEGHKGGLTYRALPILMAAYKGQFRQEVTPSIIVHSDNSLIKY